MTQFQAPFSAADAITCMNLSSWAYLPFELSDAGLKVQLAGVGLSLVDTLSEQAPGGSVFKSVRNDTQAFCAEGADRVFIVFRGSEQKVLDWLTDLRVEKTRVAQLPGAELHEGFYGSLSGPKTSAALEKWTRHAPDKPIVLTGHSLGGALAAMTAVLYPALSPGLSFASCYTFGQPRIGLFKAAPATPICRVVNKADIVPRVPVDFVKLVADTLGGAIASGFLSASSWLGAFKDVEYQHVGSAYVIGQEGTLEPGGEAAYERFVKAAIVASAGELIALVEHGRGFAYQGDLVSDHFRESYLASLKGLP